MIAFPNAKINLGLNVLSKREDGYHTIETVMAPVSFCDILEVIPAPGKGIEFSHSGLGIPGKPEDNLIITACRLFSERTASIGVQMHLHKVLPPGSGLGGGSSDAASTLLLLNELFQAGLTEADLMALAAQLGSDCPFFILNKPALAMGRGDILENVALDLRDKNIILVLPGIHVSTAWAYAQVRPCRPGLPVSEAIGLEPRQWREYLVNDFEKPVFKAFPSLEEIRNGLYEAGAIYTAMSGSGSAIFGLFEEVPEGLASRFKSCQVIQAKILG